MYFSSSLSISLQAFLYSLQEVLAVIPFQMKNSTKEKLSSALWENLTRYVQYVWVCLIWSCVIWYYNNIYTGNSMQHGVSGFQVSSWGYNGRARRKHALLHVWKSASCGRYEGGWIWCPGHISRRLSAIYLKHNSLERFSHHVCAGACRQPEHLINSYRWGFLSLLIMPLIV